jgi:TolA-binding protein
MMGRRWLRGPRRCPAPVELSRAFSEGASPEIAIHLRACAACASEWASLERLDEVVASLPVPSLSDERREYLAARLGASLEGPRAVRDTRRSPWWWTWAAIGSAVAAGSGLWALRHNRVVEPGTAVTVQSVGAASFKRARPLPDEVVRLEDGTIHLEVRLLETSERLRVETADAELEIGSGRFDVTATHDQLIAVRVWSGHTELRGSSFHIDLRDGDAWTKFPTRPVGASAAPAPSLTTPSATTSTSAMATEALRHPVPRGAFASGHVSRRLSAFGREAVGPTASVKNDGRDVSSLPAPRSDARPAPFEQAWQLLRAGDSAGAADAFREVVRTSDGSVREQGTFWLGVAQARAGRSREARATLEAFIEGFPTSSRRGEASAVLGWLLVDAHELVSARRASERAASDPVDRVRASAANGLARVASEPGM